MTEKSNFKGWQNISNSSVQSGRRHLCKMGQAIEVVVVLVMVAVISDAKSSRGCLCKFFSAANFCTFFGANFLIKVLSVPFY